MITDQLSSFYYTDYSNIYASPDDNLVVADVDHDGDMDILNFWVLGKYVHFQRNYALENNLANGWLDFRLEDECWGKFSEGADNNEISLLSYCQSKNEEPTRHVGSTMTLTDFNHDGLEELILGDIDFAQVVLLTNGGTLSEALMVAQTTAVPNAVNPISLYSMPLVSSLDLNGDNIPELPRLSFQECADRCAADFEKAYDLLPLDWDETPICVQYASGKNDLRVNKFMALCYLGKCYLWAGSPLMKEFEKTKNGGVAQLMGASSNGKTYDYDRAY